MRNPKFILLTSPFQFEFISLKILLPCFDHKFSSEILWRRGFKQVEFNRFIKGITRQQFPLIEDTQTERLSGCVDSQIGFKAERIDRREDSLERVQRRTRLRILIDDMSSSLHEYIDATFNRVGSALDFDMQQRFHQSRLSH